MRFVLVAQALFFAVLFGPSASAQYYSFEEACRNAGLTTGACAPKSQQRQSTECVKIGGNAFHAEKSRGKCTGECIEATLSPVFDAEIFIELLGLPNINKMNELKLIIRRAVGCNNAMALFHKGARTIIHDPEWARTAGAEFYLVLGHEVGHHFCGHTLESAQQSPHEAELEADRFSGASIKRFEVYHGRPFLQDALAASARLYSESGSRSHPPRAARMEAVKLGYTSGSPCGNLAPAIRGFSPQRR